MDSSILDKYPKDSCHQNDIDDKGYYYTRNHIQPQMIKVLLSERIRYKYLMKSSSSEDYTI